MLVCGGLASPRRAAQQHKDSDDLEGVPSVHFYYCFMGEKTREKDKTVVDIEAWEKSDDMLKILIVKLGRYKRIRSHLVPKKGTSGQPWVAKAVAEDIKVWAGAVQLSSKVTRNRV